MLNRLLQWHGLFLVLLALIVQVGAGAVVPRADSVVAAGVLCHVDDGSGGTPPQVPPHCLVCPLCSVPHHRIVALLPPGVVILPPGVLVVVRAELPPPSTAPPAPHRFASQPRAPPTLF